MHGTRTEWKGIAWEFLDSGLCVGVKILGGGGEGGCGEKGVVGIAWVVYVGITYVSPSYSKTASQPGIYTISLNFKTSPSLFFVFPLPLERFGKLGLDGVG